MSYLYRSTYYEGPWVLFILTVTCPYNPIPFDISILDNIRIFLEGTPGSNKALRALDTQWSEEDNDHEMTEQSNNVHETETTDVNNNNSDKSESEPESDSEETNDKQVKQVEVPVEDEEEEEEEEEENDTNKTPTIENEADHIVRIKIAILDLFGIYETARHLAK